MASASRGFAWIGLVMLATAACGGGSGGSSVGSTSEAVSAEVTPDEPENFALVSPGIYRGGHPDAGGLDYLQSLGITTIIDLEIDDLIEATASEIDAEVSGATALGMNDIREPMSAFELALSSSFDAKIDQILAILADPTQKPVYVHCAHGQDRTGLVIGLERVFNEGWTPAAAWDEMLARGFHAEFLGLSDYFFRKTGWTPSGLGEVDAGTEDAGVDAGNPGGGSTEADGGEGSDAGA